MSQQSAARYQLFKLLYPGNTAANCAGGLPTEISSMTYEELKAFHSAYYHPSNALITLYGILDLERFLTLIDGEYLSRFDRADIDLADARYTPATGFTKQTVEYPVSSQETSQTMIFYGLTLRGMTEADQLVMENAAQMLTTEGMPIQTLLKEKLPNAIIDVTYTMSEPDPTLYFIFANVSAEDTDAAKAIVDEGLAQSAAGGLNKELLNAVVKRARFDTLLTAEDKNVGVTTGIATTQAWADHGDLAAYQRRCDAFTHLGEAMASGEVERILQAYAVEPAASAMIVSVSVPGGKEAQSAALTQQLHGMKTAMTDAEQEQLIARTADFAAWTETNAKTSLINEMKAVTVATLPEELTTYTAQEEALDGIRFVTCEAPASGVISLVLYLDTSCLTLEELPYYYLYASRAGTVDTDSRTQEQVVSAIAGMQSYQVSATTLNHEDGTYTPCLRVNWMTFAEDLPQDMALIEDILLHSKIGPYDDLRTFAANTLLGNTVLAGSVGDVVAMQYASSFIAPRTRYQLYLNGSKYDDMLKQISTATDDTLDEIVAEAERVWQKVVNRNRMIVTAVGDAAGINAVRTAVTVFADTLNDEEQPSLDLTSQLPLNAAPLAVETSSDVLYNTSVLSFRDAGVTYSGTMDAASQYVLGKFLLPILRFQNSAYGIHLVMNTDGLMLMSYRDPGLQSTYDVYAQLGGMIRAADITQEELDNYIISAYTAHAMPFGSLTGGNAAVLSLLQGTDVFAETLEQMRALKSMTPEDVKALADLFDLAAEKGYKVTVGNAAIIEENKDFFAEIVTDFLR